MKTIKDLAREALAVQGACNLSGVVHSFSQAMTELREIARAEGWESTEKLNTHPVAIMYSSKIASLTNSDDKFREAYSWVCDQGVKPID
jgi:hypothetical protein